MLLLIPLIALYVVSISPNNPINEWRVLTHLRLKYFKNFEIVEVLETSQVQTQGFSLDGPIIMPKKKAGEYFYRYKVLSTSDDVKFYVYFHNIKGIGIYADTYDVCSEIDNTVEDIEWYIREIMEDESIEIKYLYSDDSTKTLNCDCEIQFKITGYFADVFSQDYLDKLYLIRQYMEMTNQEFDNKYSKKSDGDVDFRLIILDDSNKDRIELENWRIDSRDYNYDRRVEDTYGWIDLDSYLDYVETYCTNDY